MTIARLALTMTRSFDVVLLVLKVSHFGEDVLLN